MTHQVETYFPGLIFFRLFAHFSIAHCWIKRSIVQGFQHEDFSYSRLVSSVLY